MAHECFNCGSECYCHGDIDDCILSKTPTNCEGCGCQDNDEDEEYDNDEYEFDECEVCDGHESCRDFGCAIELGLRRMVKSNYESL